MSNTSIHISLSDTLRDYLQERVREGGYSNPSDYVRSLIRADREQAKRHAALARDIDVGLTELDRGEGRAFDETTAEGVKRRGRKRLDKTA
jgi:antitoxin ParD1/3/4